MESFWPNSFLFFLFCDVYGPKHQRSPLPVEKETTPHNSHNKNNFRRKRGWVVVWAVGKWGNGGWGKGRRLGTCLQMTASFAAVT